MSEFGANEADVAEQRHETNPPVLDEEELPADEELERPDEADDADVLEQSIEATEAEEGDRG
jgi:hypothetical protein